MTAEDYLTLRSRLLSAGYAEELDWAATVGPPRDAVHLALEYTHVVVNSGMKAQIAEKIHDKIKMARAFGNPASSVFGHKAKAAAIDEFWESRFMKFTDFSEARFNGTVLSWCLAQKWIGPITMYHLARNLGADVCKPDRHLVRIAAKVGKSPHDLCAGIAAVTGHRIGAVDGTIWRAANLGWV